MATKAEKDEAAKQKHADLVAQAQKLGISVDGRSDKQLEASIKQASLQGDEHVLPGEKSEVKAGKGHNLATVIDRNGEVIRTYSKDQHGSEFVDHANEFASKEEGRVVKTSKAGASEEDDESEEEGDDE